MKSAENIESALLIGNAAKLLLCAHGMDDIIFILSVIADVQKQLAELTEKLVSFKEASK